MLQIVIYKKLNFWEEYTPLWLVPGCGMVVVVPGCGTCSEGTRSTPGSRSVIFANLGTKKTLNYFCLTLSSTQLNKPCLGQK